MYGQILKNFLFPLFINEIKIKKILTICLFSISFCAIAGNKTENEDVTKAKSDTKNALSQQLYGATIATTNLEQSLLFYRDGMGLTVQGPVSVSEKTKQQQRKLWDIPKEIDWQLYLLTRPTVESAIKIRLLVLNKPTPMIHKSWSSMELGPFSLGFPNENQQQVDQHLRKLGFGTQAEMQRYELQRPDGSKYAIYETIFNGPDFVKGVGIYRDQGMPQLSPVDPATQMGGPGYSAQIINNSDQIIDFYTKVLDMELRADREWTTSGALGAPAGTKYRFMLVYAKGASAGHLLFVDYINAESIDTGVAPRLPNRGMGMWTFPVKSLEKVLKRAKANNIKIVAKAKTIDSPLYGKAKVATLIAPNGFLVEIFETIK